MRSPGFWYRAPGLAAAVLHPLGSIYAAATARRLKRGARAKLAAPVICIGNLTAGGAGKTPVAMHVATELAGQGAAILSRGYGGRATGPLRVDPARHTADEVGDEPLLLAAFAPVWVAKDRARGAAAAIADGAKILVLDDGYQDPSLAHDLSILVVDAARGFGNGHAIPAGPLREAIAPGLARADLVIAIGTVEARTDFIATWGHAMSVPILGAMLRPLPTGLPLSGTPVLAFAGIADPARFFATLRGLGADLRKAIPLADHQPLAPTLISRLLREARAEGAIVVTTEKDAVRLPAALRQQITALPVRLSLENDTELSDRLAAVARTRNGAKASV